MRMENITESRFMDLHAEKAWNKIFFPSWSQKPRANERAHIAFLRVRNRVSCFFTCKARYSYFSFTGIVSVRSFIKIGSQDCLLDQITYKRWLRNLCGELCEMESMQSKKRKRKQRVGLYQKSHWFAAHTCSISDTTNSCVKYLTDRLSMQYSLSIELS